MGSILKEKREQLEWLKNGAGINYVLNEAYKILENPIVMFDTSYNLLDCVDGIVTDDRLWNEITDLGTFSHESVDFFNKENFIVTYAQSNIVSFMKSDKLKYDRMVGKLFDKDDVQLGSICVVACMRPFEEGDAELIEIVSEILSAELQNSEFYQRINRVYQESTINILIDGEIKDDKTVKTKIMELYKGLKSNLYLLVVDTTQYEHTITHLAYFRDLFKKIQAEYQYYIHFNYIVVIVSTSNALPDIKRDLSKLNEFFTKYKIYAGISSKFHDLLELKKCYRQAISALNYGLKSKRTQQIFRYDDIRVEHFLNSVKYKADIGEIYSPVIFLIQEYDKENNTSLLESLYTYLLYWKDAKLTCEKLGITKKKLKQYLNKLEGIFKIEWDNGDMLYNIFISIKMLDSFSLS